jgi:hypothetical protein
MYYHVESMIWLMLYPFVSACTDAVRHNLGMPRNYTKAVLDGGSFLEFVFYLVVGWLLW